ARLGHPLGQSSAAWRDTLITSSATMWRNCTDPPLACRAPGLYTWRMKTRKLGKDGPDVSAIGLGCMGMSEFYGPASEDEAIATIHQALDRGVTLIDTADVYGPFTNERLVGRALAGRRDGVVL